MRTKAVIYSIPVSLVVASSRQHKIRHNKTVNIWIILRRMHAPRLFPLSAPRFISI